MHGEQIRRGAHREPLEVVQRAPVPELVRDAGAQLLVGERVEHRPRDQQARTQHADQRHHRRVGVDRKRRHRVPASASGRPARIHAVRASRRARQPTRRARPPRRATASASTANVVSVTSNPSTDFARLVAPVGRQEQDGDERESTRRPATAEARARSRAIRRSRTLRQPRRQRSRPPRSTTTFTAETRRAPASRRAAGRAARSSALLPICRAPLFANQTLELVEQRPIAIRDRVDQRRQQRQRLAAMTL